MLFLPFLSLAQNSGQKEKITLTKLDSVVVEVLKAGKNTPVTHSELNLNEIRQASPIQSLPMALSLMPSVVSSTEGGNGLGYSSLRVRGSDGSRINVTLNGIAINDAESQEVFWVNIPSIMSVLQDVQLQRGVGTSSNGPAAFGASINMNSLYSQPSPYGLAELGVASYNTFLSTFGAGTGLLKNGLSFDIRFSHNSGDGYIRNAKTDLNSLFISAGWLHGISSLRVNYIMGDQMSGITWEGISREQMNENRRYNPSGVYYDHVGNIHYYDNETDNYKQHHLQLNYTLQPNTNLTWSTTLHYTKGDGYYENYKSDKDFSDYGLPAQTLKGITYSSSNFIVQQAMDNGNLTINSILGYNKENLKCSTGLSYSYYDGDHFGKVIWSMIDQNIPEKYKWYTNTGYKNDYSLFIKGEYGLSEDLVGYLDMQYRGVKYTIRGEDKDFVNMNFDKNYSFFNPKAGLTYNPDKNNQIYLSAAVGHREPCRTDIKESIKANKTDELKPERMIDYEFGYKLTKARFLFSANIYMMEYKNQLVPTGKLSETGYVIKENVSKSYRRGIEIAAGWDPCPFLKIEGNLTLSKNKIKDYTDWTNVYDNSSDWNLLSQKSTFYKTTDISYSPEVIGMCKATATTECGTFFSLMGKYVGKQYYDNTASDTRSIPSYYTVTFQTGKSFHINGKTYLDLQFFIDNLLDRKYYSNAWGYISHFADGTADYLEEGLFPQAVRNYTLKASFRF